MPDFINAENAYTIALEFAQMQEWPKAKYYFELCLASLDNYLNNSDILAYIADETYLNRCKWALHHIPNIITLFNQFSMVETAAYFSQIKQIYSLLNRFSVKLNYLQLTHFFQLAEHCFSQKLTPNEILYVIGELTKLLTVTIPNDSINETHYQIKNIRALIVLLQNRYNQSNISNQLSRDDGQSKIDNIVWTGITSATAEYIHEFKLQLVKHGVVFPQVDLQILLVFLMDKTKCLNESAEDLKKQWVAMDLTYRGKDEELNALKRKAEMLEQEHTALKMRIEGKAPPSETETTHPHFPHRSPQTSTTAKKFRIPNLNDFEQFALSEPFYYPVCTPANVFSTDLAVSIVNLVNIKDQLNKRFAFFHEKLQHTALLCNYVDKSQDVQREQIAALESKNSVLKTIIAAMEFNPSQVVPRTSRTTPASDTVSPANPSLSNYSFSPNTSPAKLFKPIIVPPNISMCAPDTTRQTTTQRCLFTFIPPSRN